MTVYQLTIGGQTKRSTSGQHPVSVDWNGLPDVSQDFIVKYGLKQYLADAIAGADGAADAAAKLATRLAKLVAGDMSRTRGEGSDKPDTDMARALKLAKAEIRARLKAQNKTATKEQIQSAAQATVEKNPKWLAAAQEQLKAEAEAKAALAESDDLDDLMDDLFPEDEDTDDTDDEEYVEKGGEPEENND